MISREWPFFCMAVNVRQWAMKWWRNWIQCRCSFEENTENIMSWEESKFCVTETCRCCKITPQSNQKTTKIDKIDQERDVMEKLASCGEILVMKGSWGQRWGIQKADETKNNGSNNFLKISNEKGKWRTMMEHVYSRPVTWRRWESFMNTYLSSHSVDLYHQVLHPTPLSFVISTSKDVYYSPIDFQYRDFCNLHSDKKTDATMHSVVFLFKIIWWHFKKSSLLVLLPAQLAVVVPDITVDTQGTR